MSLTRYAARVAGILVVGVATLCAQPAVNRPPLIKHEPVRAAVAGQPLSIRATVTDADGAVKGVKLFYSASRDAAPFKAAMAAAGADLYVGTIPASALAGTSQVSYYLEATDDEDLTTETPWYAVTVQSATGGLARASTVAPAPEPHGWGKTALYAGGAAALVGAGLLAASGGGGGGGGGGSTTNVGTYAGAVTTCIEYEGQSPNCASHSMSIQVLSDGSVSSDNLYRSQHLEARLSGSDFTLAAEVQETGLTGQILFQGTLLPNRIVGSVSGSAHATGGTNATYSGTFTATRAATQP